MVIRVLVFADSHEEARELAEEVLGGLLESGEFDYGTFFDEDSMTAGRSRRGQYPPVAEIRNPSVEAYMAYQLREEQLDPTDESLSEEERAWAMVLEGVRFTVHEQRKALKTLRMGLREYSDEDFWKCPKEKERRVAAKHDDKFLTVHWVKFACHQLGQTRGPSVFLYDQDGEGITDEEHLLSVLNRWKNVSDRYLHKRLFVVPIDVHFLGEAMREKLMAKELKGGRVPLYCPTCGEYLKEVVAVCSITGSVYVDAEWNGENGSYEPVDERDRERTSMQLEWIECPYCGREFFHFDKSLLPLWRMKWRS